MSAIAIAALAACSGGKPHAVEDGRAVQPVPLPRDALAPRVGVNPPGPYKVGDLPAKGDVQVRVEWHDVPAVARAAAGRTACGTPRAPAVAPTTTWGIPDVFVMIDVERGNALADPGARIVLEHCALSPRAIVAGSTITIASGVAPASPSLARFSAMLGGTALADKPRLVALPIAGHEVSATLEPGSQYVVSLASGDPETAWIYAASTPYVAVTEASGQVVIRDVPVGTQRVTAWLPPRSGQPARIARGTAAVTAGGLAELTLDITAP